MARVIALYARVCFGFTVVESISVLMWSLQCLNVDTRARQQIYHDLSFVQQLAPCRQKIAYHTQLAGQVLAKPETTLGKMCSTEPSILALCFIAS